MQAFRKLVLTLGAVALMAAPAFAQGRGGGGMFGGGPGALLSNKGVQKELKLDDEQVKKVETLSTELREKMTGLREKLQDVPQEERGEKMRELMKPINDDMKKSLAGILKPEQVKRLDQIQLQQQGVNAFADPETAKKLNLTDEQKDKLKGIVEDHRSQQRELFQGFQNDREGTMKKIQDLNKETMGKVTGLLTADQKATWKEMTGEPFTVQFQQRRPGGGR